MPYSNRKTPEALDLLIRPVNSRRLAYRSAGVPGVWPRLIEGSGSSAGFSVELMILNIDVSANLEDIARLHAALLNVTRSHAAGHPFRPDRRTHRNPSRCAPCRVGPVLGDLGIICLF